MRFISDILRMILHSKLQSSFNKLPTAFFFWVKFSFFKFTKELPVEENKLCISSGKETHPWSFIIEYGFIKLTRRDKT